MSDCDRHLPNKRQAYAILGELAAAPVPRIASVLKRAYHDDANWFGSHPLNERHGVAAIKEVWRDMPRALLIFIREAVRDGLGPRRAMAMRSDPGDELVNPQTAWYSNRLSLANSQTHLHDSSTYQSLCPGG